MSDVTVGVLLKNITQLLTYNGNLVAEVRDDFQSLSQELSSLRELMRDFSRHDYDSSNIKKMAYNFREIVADAEDALDTYTALPQLQSSRIWASKANHHITNHSMMLRNVREQIRELSYSIQKINEAKSMTGFEMLPHQPIQVLDPVQRNEEPKFVEDHVIGFDEAAEHVEYLLTEGAENLEVVTILGMLGLGKTTLARKVFNGPEVIGQYMIRAFVPVSLDFDKRKVMLKILASFTHINYEVTEMNETQLENYLRNQLLGKPYLIVLDDVWEPMDWDRLKGAFPNNARRCRVLLTSRNESVGRYANPSRYYNFIYKLDFLCLEDCRKLLRWRVFRENLCPVELEKYEIEIAKKCDGLPLAIVIIAGIILINRDRIDWWKKVAESVQDDIARDTPQTVKVIELTYKHLPDHLKSCFLYLGVFPEDEIHVWKLVRLWMSEGFIESECRVDLEEMAEQYLEELVDRNLVLVTRRRRNGKIKTCSLQKTLREFCKTESAEENLYREIKNYNMDFFLSGNSILDTYRRLCVNNANILEYISSTPSGKLVRSLLTSSTEKISVEAELVSNIQKVFKFLRVLEFESLFFNRFPVDLCNLVLLKYLAISTYSANLPSSLSMLLNLQTLIVKTSSPTLDIKADIWQMPEFRHLHTNSASTLPTPVTKGQNSTDLLSGKNIRTLCTISPESCKKELFERTPNLKKLSICGTLNMLYGPNDDCSFFELLSNLESLENLKLLNDDIRNKLPGLPSKEHFPKQLKQLTLSNTLLNWKEMNILGALENLEVLKLKEFAFVGKMWQTGKGRFRRLKHLYIGRTDLEIWEAFVDPFPQLESLELNGCEKLQAIPHGFIDVSTLRLMVLHCTNPCLVYTARRLQTVKMELAKKTSESHSFKLSIYPPEYGTFPLI